MSHPLITSINQAVSQKIAYVEKTPGKYLIRAAFAGLYLTLAGVVSLYVSANFMAEASHWGKLLNGFIFGIGLVIIVFMGAELATSNMMYLTSAALQKQIKWSQGFKLLLWCSLGNLLGCLLTAYLLSLASPFQGLSDDAYLFTAVSAKISKPILTLFVDGILANILVNIAIMGQMQLKNEMARMAFMVCSLFIFVYFGFEHVVANFGSFSLAYFLGSDQSSVINLGSILLAWLIVYLGNFFGGGLIMGATNTWFYTSKKDQMIDQVP